MTKRLLILLPILLVLGAVAAFAYFTTTGSGSANASVGTLTAPGQPSRTNTGATIALSWTASTVSGGGTIGYHVERSTNPFTTWSDACTTTALSTTTSATCTDSPSAGTYRYRVTAIFNSWTAVSPVSDAFVAAASDTTPPTNSLSLTAQSPAGSSFLSGSTVYYRGTGGGSGGSFVIRNAVSDGGSGPASSTTAALGGTTSGWTHTPSTVSTPAGGPYDSNTFTWTEGTSSPTEVVTGADVAGNTAAEPTLTFTNDSTAPTDGVLTVNGQSATAGGTSGYSTSTSFAIDTRTDYTDAGSGLASSVLTVQSFVLASTGGILNGGCGAPSAPFASPTVVSGTTQPGGIVTALCYTYSLTGTDNLGITTSISTTVKVDTTAPNAPTISLSTATGSTFISGTTVFINAQVGKSGSFSASAIENDLQSGILSVEFPLLTGFSSGGGSDLTSPYSSGTYSWSAAVGASGSQTVTGTNNAGLTNTSSFTVTPDATNPVSGALSVNNQIATSGGSSGYSTSTVFLIFPRTDYTDSGSGLASSVLTVQSFTLSSSDGTSEGTCGAPSAPFASPAVIGGTTQPPGIVTGRCYTYTLTGTDNVGNMSSVSTTVKVDTTAAAAPAITLSAATGNTFINGTTVFINAQAGKSGSFSASATTTDAESGIVRVIFPALTGFTSGGGSDLTSPYSSGTYNWSGAVGASGSQTVSAPNYAGVAPATSSFTVTSDTTAPTGGALTVNGGSAGSTTVNTTGTFQITLRTNYTDGGSGLASSTLVREDAALAANVCDTTWANATTITAAVPVTQGAGQGITSAKCYRYTLTGTDNVGNAVSISTTVKVDAIAPTGTITAPAGGSTAGGTVAVSSSDAADTGGSGLASVAFQVKPSASGSFTTINTADTSAPYTTDWDTTTVANGSYLLRAINTDNAGNTFTTAQITVTVSNTFTVAAPASATAGTSFSVTITKKSAGVTDTAYTGTHTIAFSGPGNAPDGTAPSYPATMSFTNGVATATVTLVRAQSATLTATEGQSTGTSGSINVVAGTPTKLWYVTTSAGTTQACPLGSVAVGNGGTLTVFAAVVDSLGNLTANGASARTVTLSRTPTTGGGNAPSPASLTIAASANPAVTSASSAFTLPSGSPADTTYSAASTSLTGVSCIVKKI